MNDLSNDQMPDSYPAAAWTWHNGKGGLLSTQIFSSGQVRQQRKHDPNDEVTPQNLGAIPPAQAAAILAHCREALSATPAGNANSPQAAAGGETYELTLAESADRKSSRQVARAALSADKALKSVRREVLGVRKKVYRRWNIWTSAGARWFFAMTAVTLTLALYMAFDMKHDNQLQSRAQKMTGTVVDRGGVPYKTEFLKVKLDGDQTAPEVRISAYLSHPNWIAANTGSQVNVLYDAKSGQAWLAADLLRWQSDKKTIWILPGFLLLTAFLGLAWLRRYQIGLHSDGQEYMIHEDRVVSDDKSYGDTREDSLWYKMFV